MRLGEEIACPKMSPLTSALGIVTLNHVVTASLLPNGGHLGSTILDLEISSKIQKSENDILFSNDKGKLGKRNSECSYQESNLRPSDY